MDIKRKLIELIKNHAVLFNTTLPEYKDIPTRSEAWSQIAQDMDMTAENCKQEWSKLRNSYVNALRRRVALHNRDGRILPPWVFETELSFLKPFMTGRGFDDTPYTELVPDHSFDFDHSVIAEHIQEDEQPEKKRKKKLKIPKVEMEDTYEIMEPEPEMEPDSFRSNYQDIRNDLDADDWFFLSLSQTFKTLDKIEQCRLKMVFFKIINDAEMKHLESLRMTKMKRRNSSCSSE